MDAVGHSAAVGGRQVAGVLLAAVRGAAVHPAEAGRKPGCLKPVAFRAELRALIESFRDAGGLSGFSLAYRSNALDATASAAHRRLVSKLAHTSARGRCTTLAVVGRGLSGTTRGPTASCCRLTSGASCPSWGTGSPMPPSALGGADGGDFRRRAQAESGGGPLVDGPDPRTGSERGPRGLCGRSPRRSACGPTQSLGEGV